MTVNFGMYSPYMNPYMMNGDIMTTGMMGGFMMNPQAQISYMNQWDKYGVDRQVNLYKSQNNAQFQMSAQTDGISRQVQILSEKAQANGQNHIQYEYDKLVQAVKDTYGSQFSQGATAEQAQLQAKAFAERIYTQQTGSSLTNDIRKNSSGSFLEGMKQVLTFGLGNRTTSEENIAKINGTKLSKLETAKKYTGYAAGGATLAVGGTMLYKYSRPIGQGIMKALKFLFTKA